MTEPKVVRYDYDWHDMAKHPRGEYVRHSDYEALAARVEELEELAEWRAQAMDRRERVVKTQDAEITRLREALERITEISAKDSGYADYARWQMMLTEARRALKEKP